MTDSRPFDGLVISVRQCSSSYLFSWLSIEPVEQKYSKV